MDDNRLVLGTTSAVLFTLRAIDRDLYYRFVGGLASDLEVVDGVVERLSVETLVKHMRVVMTFEAWISFGQLARDQNESLLMGGILDTPLMRRYKAVLAESESEVDSSPSKEVERASEVLRLVEIIGRDSRHYRGTNFQAAIQRIELLSPELASGDSAA